MASDVTRSIQANVQCLHKLTDVPENPAETGIPPDDGERQLAIIRERQLVDEFAFLSATTDDPSKVMALGLEEDHDHMGLTIRLACNTGVPSETVDGFKKLAVLLEITHRRARSYEVLLDEIFTHVVKFDLYRILARLRSRRVQHRKSTRVQLLHLLRDCIIQLDCASKRLQKGVLEKAETAVRMFDRFEKRSDRVDSDENIQEIQNLIKVICEFHEHTSAVLDRTQKINPSISRSLPSNLTKVGRYWLVAQSITRAAWNRKYSVFSSVRIVAIESPTAEMLWAGRVHAEIQLLYFYEMNTAVPAPRIIGSSKSACFLCEAFVRCHYRFHIIRSHGRLYPQWTLPSEITTSKSAEVFCTTLQKFDKILQQKVDSFRRNTRSRKRCNPDESTAVIYQAWSLCSSVLTSASGSMASTMTERGLVTGLEEQPQGSALALALRTDSTSSSDDEKHQTSMYPSAQSWAMINNKTSGLCLSSRMEIFVENACGDLLWPESASEGYFFAFSLPYCGSKCSWRLLAADIRLSDLTITVPMISKNGSIKSDKFMLIANDSEVVACKFVERCGLTESHDGAMREILEHQIRGAMGTTQERRRSCACVLALYKVEDSRNNNNERV